MKKGWLLGLIMGILIMAAGIAVPAFAWGPDGSSHTNGSSGTYLDQPTLTRMAQALNMTREQLISDLESGKTLTGIASEMGVSEEALVEAVIAPCRDQIRSQQNYGYITQEQAYAYLQEEEAYARTLLDQDLSDHGTNDYYPSIGMYDYCYDMMGGWRDGWDGLMGNGWWGCMNGTIMGEDMVGGPGWSNPPIPNQNDGMGRRMMGCW